MEDSTVTAAVLCLRLPIPSLFSPSPALYSHPSAEIYRVKDAERERGTVTIRLEMSVCEMGE